MKFLICEVTETMMDTSDEYSFFKGADGKFYDYEVDFDGETVRITDTIGRMVPVDVSEIGSLAFILNRINNYVKSKATLNDFLFQKLVEGASVS